MEDLTGTGCVIEGRLILSHRLDAIGGRVQGTPGCHIIHLGHVIGEGRNRRGDSQGDTRIGCVRKIVVSCQSSDSYTRR